MTVSLAEVGRRAKLDITFAGRQGRTTIADAYYEVPFKITRLHDSRSNGPAHLILMQCTPGVLGGDELECTMRVAAGARVLVTQQSATRVHPSCGRRATIHTRIHVEGGGELHFHCDPIIPFSGARLLQSTHIELQPGARFSYWESFMAGRIGRGELWQFDELNIDTRIYRGDRLIYLDRFRLNPSQSTPATTWALGNGSYTATGLFFGGDAAALASSARPNLQGAGVDTPEKDLAIFRFVSDNGPDLHHYRDIFAASVIRGQTTQFPNSAQEFTTP